MSAFDPVLRGRIRCVSSDGNCSSDWDRAPASELCRRLEEPVPPRLKLPAGALCGWVMKDHRRSAPNVVDAYQVAVSLADEGYVIGKFGSPPEEHPLQPSLARVTTNPADWTDHEFVEIHWWRLNQIAKAAGGRITEDDVQRGLTLASKEGHLADVIKVLFRPLNPETGERDLIGLLVDRRRPK